MGLTVKQLFGIVPNAQIAEDWFEKIMWGVDHEKRHCGHCSAMDTVRSKSGRPMKYRCRTCKKYFDIKTGTMLQGTHIPLDTWIHAIYLAVTSIKGISSMKIHRELGVTQKTAWHLMHRIRMAMDIAHTLVGHVPMDGTVQMDEMYVGGLERNRHASKKLRLGRGAVGKTAVVGIRHNESGLIRAQTFDNVNQQNVHEFLHQNVKSGTEVHTDDARVYDNLEQQGFKHKSVKHSAGEYVKDGVTTNSIESYWALFKRGVYGTYHHLSRKHLDRYLEEFSGRHNIRAMNTWVQIVLVMGNIANTHLPYKELIADPEAD